LLVLLLLPGTVAGATELACDGLPIRSEARHKADTPVPMTPPSADRPTGVEINLQITELSDINALASTFRFEGYGDFRWCDPRFAFDAETEGHDVRRFFGTTGSYPVWSVDLSIANGVGATEVTRRLIEIHPDGSIRVSGYFNSVVAAPFDLRLFPFDHQALEIRIESFTYNGEAIQLMTSRDHVSYGSDLFLPEWQIVEIDAHVEPVANLRDRVPFSRAVISLHLAREWEFYVYKLWIPLLLIVSLSWSPFWMRDETLANRIRISATAFLTIVAYQFANSGNLPKIAYLTLMDRLMIASFVLIALSALQSMLVAEFQEKNPGRAVALDRISRWLFPLTYVSYIAVTSIVYLR
jgi:hypothetical protein